MGEQQLKTAPDTFGHVGNFAGQFDDLIHKDCIDRVQSVFDREHGPSQCCLFIVGVGLDLIEFFDQGLYKIDLGTAKSGRK